MADRWGYEVRSHPEGDGRFLIAIHHYRHLGPVSTDDEIEFDTVCEAIDWLKDELNA